MTSASALSGQKRLLLQGLLSGDAAGHRRPGDRVEPRRWGEATPLSAEQSQVWLHASMAADRPLYNEAITIHRSGSFRLDVLESALNEVLRRHEIWRSSIEVRKGRAQWIAHPGLRLKLQLVDLGGLARGVQDREACRIATEDARRPFDLGQAPLLRAKVVRLAPDRHRLYLTLHHIIFDGVSIYRILLPELAAIYGAFERGEATPLAPPSLQYGDYACWQAARAAAGAGSRQLRYWREKLGGELPELRLPSDRERPPAPTYGGSMETFELTPQFTAALKAFSAREGVTLYVTLLAAFKAMLHRYSGQDDIVIGGVTDTRRRPELESVIGYFLNSVALRTRPSGATTFRDYLAEVQTTVIEALDASEAPFDRVVREVRPRRDGARHPLFQVLFSIEPPAPAFSEGWDLTQMDVIVGTAKFDLYLELDEHRGRLIGRFLYSTDLFEAATIRRMIGHWKTLLEGATREPQTMLAALPLLTPGERRAILTDRNDTARAYPATTLHAWIEAQARRTPERIAAACDGERWTYGDLERRATVLAAELRRAGARRGALAGIAMERSLDMVAGLLAILKTGAAYLPLDPGLPQARLALMIEDARPAVVLADAAAAGRLGATGVRIVDAAAARARAGAERETVPVEPASPDDLAYVLYTSGSTGRPKAVEIRHRSVVNLLAAVQGEIGFREGDTLVAVTTLSFDIAALELFLPLVAGARLVIATRQDGADPARLAALIGRSGATVVQATPATWRGLVARGWTGDPRLRILCGGEALPRDLAASLLQRSAGVWNMYGPTETTIWSLAHRLDGSEDPVPIGRPLANTRAYILDRNGAPVPDLTPGELCIAGEGLARAYLNSPELTAAKFAAPALLQGERLYRTGDLARYRADGAIEFLGRADNQVKVRGFRVALEEVEAAIAAHPRVTAAAVRASPDPSGELGLTAYLAGGALTEADFPDLRRFLAQTLPAYMVPTNYMLLPALPLTANGKVDRKQLPQPSIAASPRGRAPQDEFERQLADLWKETLGISDIGVDDDFFDLGGHSLLASLLMAKVQAMFRRALPLVALFESPTIARLARTLRSAEEPRFSHLVALRGAGAGRPLFIVHGIFGNVLQLRELAERLGSARPVYGLQARGADPRQEPHQTIAEMAEAYMAAIREVQREGPYALAGYSLGGLVAFEMARAFRAGGETVDVLALLETDLHERCLAWPQRLAYRLALPARIVGKLRALGAGSAPAYLAGKLVRLGRRLLLRLDAGEDLVASAALSGPMAQRQRHMYQIGVREFGKFEPRPYDGKLSLFRVRGPRFDACDCEPIWRRAAGSVELFEIDGVHDRIMERPYVETLARQLSRCIRACEPAPGAGIAAAGRPEHRKAAARLAAGAADGPAGVALARPEMRDQCG